MRGKYDKTRYGITEEQYRRIKKLLPKQRGNVKIENLTALSALVYICRNGCIWRALPEKFGKWHAVYVRFNRWVKSVVWKQVAVKLQPENAAEAKVLSLDSILVKTHPDAHGALKKNGKQAMGKPCGGWNTKIHAITTGDATPVKFSLSAGNAPGAKEGRRLKSVGKRKVFLLLMDRAYEDSKTRTLAEKRGFAPVVPPKRSRKEP
jgi:transposase